MKAKKEKKNKLWWRKSPRNGCQPNKRCYFIWFGNFIRWSTEKVAHKILFKMVYIRCLGYTISIPIFIIFWEYGGFSTVLLLSQAKNNTIVDDYKNHCLVKFWNMHTRTSIQSITILKTVALIWELYSVFSIFLDENIYVSVK